MRLSSCSCQTHAPYLQHFFALLLLLCVGSCPIQAGQRPQPAHPPYAATMNVALIVVPDVRGLRQEDAEARLRAAGLVPGAISSSPGPGAVGTVYHQEPQQNTSVPHGTTFTLQLVAPAKKPTSSNGETENSDAELYRTVPKLIGLTPNAASDLLARFNLQLGRVSKGTGNTSPGTIYAQKPTAGSLVRVGSGIEVAIVDNPVAPPPPPVVYVPYLIGQTQKVAEELLTRQGLNLGNIVTVTASARPGTVFAQFPLPNTKVVQGTQVNLSIAQPGKPTVPVPDLLHRDIDSARAVLSQVGLQIGELTTEQSDNPANSITAQSPEAGTLVVRGTVVNVVIAQPAPPVSVPSLVRHDQADAIALLQSVGLQLGAVNQQDNDATSGTILSQNPQAGTQAQKGTAVDVTISRQILPADLVVMVDQNNPSVGVPLRIHAHVENPQAGMLYQFTFGDDEQTKWQPLSTTTHTYKNAGQYPLRASAKAGATLLESETVLVTIPSSPLPILSMVLGTIALLSLGGGAFLYHGWRLFKNRIQLVPKLDIGTQRLSVASGESLSPSVSVRLVQGTGESKVILREGNSPRKAESN